jgi:hypothetical protein
LTTPIEPLATDWRKYGVQIVVLGLIRNESKRMKRLFSLEAICWVERV